MSTPRRPSRALAAAASSAPQPAGSRAGRLPPRASVHLVPQERRDLHRRAAPAPLRPAAAAARLAAADVELAESVGLLDREIPVARRVDQTQARLGVSEAGG